MSLWVALLGALVAHRMATGVGERPTHSWLLRVAIEVRLYVSGNRGRIHLHLWQSIHIWTVRRLLYHHVSTHLRTLRTEALGCGHGTHLHSRAHAIRWHCSWIVLHRRMQLRVVCHGRMTHTRRWLDRRIRGCILHPVVLWVLVWDEMRMSLILSRCLLCGRHRRRNVLQVWGKLVLMRHDAVVWSVQRGHGCWQCLGEVICIRFVLVRLSAVPSGSCPVSLRDTTISSFKVSLLLILGLVSHSLDRVESSRKRRPLRGRFQVF